MQLKTTHVLMEVSLKYITVKLLVNAWVSILVDLVGHKTNKLKKNIYIYIRLKIKPNSVRIRFLSCQIFVLPSTGFEIGSRVLDVRLSEWCCSISMV